MAIPTLFLIITMQVLQELIENDWVKVLAILLFTSRTMNIYITCYKKIKKDFNCQESG